MLSTIQHSKYFSSALVVIVLICTAIVWCGSLHTGFTPDDYMVIDSQSPIRSFVDAVSMFWRNDPNPQYWRPLTNTSVSLDFWLWGWQPGLFHQTNLLLHLGCTLLVFLFSRKILELSLWQSIALILFFGISASHDSNLLWIAARSDVISTTFALLTLLAAKRAFDLNDNILWTIISWILYFGALCSKEISAITIVLLPVLVWSSTPTELLRKWKGILLRMLPYLACIAIYFFIRSKFTVAVTQMQPLTSEGSHSVTAFIKNTIYSIGYIVAPVNFKTAAHLIDAYLTLGIILAVIILLIAIATIWLIRKSSIIQQLYKPLMVIAITGSVSFLSFERWRVYFPSVGVFAIAIIIATALIVYSNKQQWVRATLLVLFSLYLGINIAQSLDKVDEWVQATTLTKQCKADYQAILARHSERPINLNIITSPTKLGDAPIIQLNEAYLPMIAEAERIADPSLRYGSLGISKSQVTALINCDLYAFDRELLFSKLRTTVLEKNKLEIECDDKSEVGMIPMLITNDGIPRRDRTYKNDSSYTTDATSILVLKSRGAFIQHAIISILPQGIPIYLKENHLVEME